MLRLQPAKQTLVASTKIQERPTYSSRAKLTIVVGASIISYDRIAGDLQTLAGKKIEMMRSMIKVYLMKTMACSISMLLTFAAQPAFADFWVGVAVNQQIGQHGNSFFLESRSAAERSALSQCRKFSKGADGCEVVLVTRQCSGMAHAGPNIFVTEGSSASNAGTRALSTCEAHHGSSCRVHETFCPNN